MDISGMTRSLASSLTRSYVVGAGFNVHALENQSFRSSRLPAVAVNFQCVSVCVSVCLWLKKSSSPVGRFLNSVKKIGVEQ